MKKTATLIFSLLLFFSCNNNKIRYVVSTNFRFNLVFYSIFFNKNGYAYVIKGRERNQNGELQPYNCDTSTVFQSDSIKKSYQELCELRSHPVLRSRKSNDAPKIEIYFDGKKIYDDSTWDNKFMSIYRSTMMELPKGYNPFAISEHPFE